MSPTLTRSEHVRGLGALPYVTTALSRFQPAVLLTTGGMGAIHASIGVDEVPSRRFWFLADARTVLDWESSRRHVVTLTFHSPDECVYLTLSGKAEVVTDSVRAAKMWRPAFKRWFPRGAEDPRLLLLQFAVDDAEFYESPDGRVASLLSQ